MKEVKKRKGVIIDIDGSLCDVDSVLHHIIGKPKHERDHDSFIAGSMECPPKQDVVEWIGKHYEMGDGLLVLTGREERYRPQSEAYVAMHVPWPIDAFKMTPDFDPRSGVDAKEALYDELVEEGWEIVGAIEDRPDIVELWEKLGIPEIVLVPGWNNEPGRAEGRL
jgi:hypothetical protein